LTVSRSARTIQRAAIPSAGRCWPGGNVARDRKIIGAFKVQHDAALATLQYGVGGMPPAGPTRWVDADDLPAP